MRAMVLAAGLGTRLRPYSLLRPKPLFPILGEPLLLRIIRQLREAGFSSIVVNAYHLGEQIVALVADQPGVIVQREAIELGTGGGLRLALPHFGEEPVLVTNGDIFHDLDYGAIFAEHCRGGAPLTMAMHDCPRFNKVVVRDGQVRAFAGGDLPSSSSPDTRARLMAFTGIHVVDPTVLRPIPSGRFASIIDRYADHLRTGGRIDALTVSGHRWTDIGTVDDYLNVHRELLVGSQPAFRLAPGVMVGREVRLEGWGYVGAGAQLGDGVELSRVVVWDGAVLPAGAVRRDCLVPDGLHK